MPLTGVAVAVVTVKVGDDAVSTGASLTGTTVMPTVLVVWVVVTTPVLPPSSATMVSVSAPL